MPVDPVKGYRGLEVWQKSMDLVEQTYAITRELPSNERYSLISQMQRAAISIPSNIAEGYGRGGKDYARFVRNARGSLMELETQLEICVRLNYLDRKSIQETWNVSQQVARMLSKLSSALHQSS